MSSDIETPEAMAERLARADWHLGEVCAEKAIRARDEQIAAWCEAKADEAQRKADGESLNASLVLSGGADAYRAVAAKLRGAR